MAKGQKRGNREIKKPKMKKQPAAAIDTGALGRGVASSAMAKKRG